MLPTYQLIRTRLSQTDLMPGKYHCTCIVEMQTNTLVEICALIGGKVMLL